MKIEQAINQLADIIVNNDQEKADVINILQVNDVNVRQDVSEMYPPTGYPQLVRLYSASCNLYELAAPCTHPHCLAHYNRVTAADFIAANTPQS